MHCVDLGESFQTHIFLQKLASIQPRTGHVKLALQARGRPRRPCVPPKQANDRHPPQGAGPDGGRGPDPGEEAVRAAGRGVGA